MAVDKKYLKLGAAALAAVALVVGLSVGITQSQKAARNDAAAAAANKGANVAMEDQCVYGKAGKSGGYRRLTVPGTEGASGHRRRDLRRELARELATDDGGAVMDMSESPADTEDGSGSVGAANAGDYYYGDYAYDYDYGTAKSGKSGNKAGKSGGYGDQCFPVYDPCNPAGPRDPCYGKSGKSGSPECAKSGKSGGYGGCGKSGKSGGGSGPGCYDYCPCDPCYGKSGKSGSPECGKSGKSGNKSGKSGNGNKSGKSGNKSGKSGGYGTCDCMPTLCPVPPPVCVCADLPFAFVNGVCTQGCGLSEGGPYATEVECCLANFPPGAGTCQVEGCTPEPTYAPTTPSPTTCVCEDLDIVFFNGQCRRECSLLGLVGAPTYPSFAECCADEFAGGSCQVTDECPTEPPTYNPTVAVTTYSPTAAAPLDTPPPTAGSTPTVSTEVTGPPTKGGREP